MFCARVYGLTLKGIARVFELDGDDTPVIASKNEFKRFVSTIKMGQHCVAVVERGAMEDSKDHSCLHVFAVMYSRQKDGDSLYIFDSEPGSVDALSLPFGKNFSSFMVEQTRQDYGQGKAACYAYAIRDARMLQKLITTKSIFNEIKVLEKGCFKLPAGFMDDIEPFRRELFKTLVLDALKLEETQAAINLYSITSIMGFISNKLSPF